MENVLLSVHVVAGILFVGPVAVATSLFPRLVPLADGEAAASAGAGSVSAGAGSAASAPRSTAVARQLHRLTRVYGVLALVVPVVGLALALVQGRLGEIWVTVAMVLTAVAGGLLALRIAPLQREALETPDDGTRLRALRALTGVFNLLWVAVVVLMIVRPGAR